MKNKSGNSIYRKVKSLPVKKLFCPFPDSNIGKKTAIDITITIIMLNAIIRYFNFNVHSPITTDCWNDKIKIILRQRYKKGVSKKSAEYK